LSEILAKYKYRILFGVICLSGLLHLPQLNLEIQGIHMWRQSQTMWNIRNFHRHDANILNTRINSFNNANKDNLYRYEFPVMQWSVAMMQHLFGERISVVRICMFLFGCIGFVGFFYLVLEIFDDPLVALLGVWCWVFSPLVFYYGINPLPDVLALSATIWYLYFIVKHRKTKRTVDLIWSSIALLFATWAKLPFLMMAIVSIYFFICDIYKNKTLKGEYVKYGAIQLLIISPALAWYAWVIPTWSNGVLTGVFDNPIPWSQTWEYIEYHYQVMFPQLLYSPYLLIIATVGLIKLPWFKNKLGWVVSVIGITLIYLILEFNMIGSVHDYYMMPFLPWMYILVASGIYYLINSKHKILQIGLVVLLVIVPIHTFIKAQPKWSVAQSYFNPDVIHHSTSLKEAVPRDARCIVLNDISGYIFSYRIDKMGYMFKDDQLPAAWIRDMIENGNAKYMYSDSRVVDERADVQPFLDSLIMQQGTVKVFSLRLP